MGNRKETVRPEIEEEELNSSSVGEDNIKPEHSEHEADLLKEAELIAKLTKEQDFGTLEDMYKDDENEEQPPIEDNQTPEDEENTSEADDETSDTIEESNENTNEENAAKYIEVQKEPEEMEHLDNDNQVFKKYIFYVSKDFVPIVDNLSTDERTAYINDAIQRKVDAEYEYSVIDKRKRILAHIITMIITFFIVTPMILFLVHKSIMLTFENYKYSQDNFEKLYKQRFEKDRAYMRSLEYNRLHNKDYKNQK